MFRTGQAQKLWTLFRAHAQRDTRNETRATKRWLRKWRSQIVESAMFFASARVIRRSYFLISNFHF
jgi:hypothetical protein